MAVTINIFNLECAICESACKSGSGPSAVLEVFSKRLMLLTHRGTSAGCSQPVAPEKNAAQLSADRLFPFVALGQGPPRAARSFRLFRLVSRLATRIRALQARLT